VTQKELMVIPNAPRFLREGDQITISAKIANLTDKQLFGQAKLILTDAVSGQDISEALIMEPKAYQTMSQQYDPEPTFSVDGKGNTQVSWILNIPFDVDAVQYKILAKAGDFTFIFTGAPTFSKGCVIPPLVVFLILAVIGVLS